MTQMDAQTPANKKRLNALWVGLVLLGIALLRFHSYLLFHTLVEALGLVVMTGVFMLAWNTRHLQKQPYYLILGTASLAVGAILLVHLLSYKGMGVFPAYDANLPTQLWIASRYVLSLSMLAAPLYMHRDLRAGRLLLAYTALTTLLLVSIFAGLFPGCYIEGEGLTPFKKISEYLISAILLGSIWTLHLKHEHFDRNVYRLMVAATIVLVISELAFTLYTGVYDYFNMGGHLFALLSYYMFYVALIETGLRRPFALLFRDLQQRNEELEAARDRLHELWTKATETEAALRESEQQVRRKLDAILMPQGDLGELELADVVDIPGLQALMDQFYAITKFGVGILDLEGRILVATGWQDICTQFHRACPATAARCHESDLALSRNVPPGTFKAYRCRNGMWDMVTPIVVGGNHLGNLFLGQFIYDDEVVDRAFFEAQAEKYGFDVDAYLEALDRVPRWSREQVEAVMLFYATFARQLSTLSYANLLLARTLAERDDLLASLQQSLDEKTVLLREVHHRVKNNLTTIIGLVMLQQNSLHDEVAVAQFQELEGRIRSISMVHELLYQSELLSRLNFEQYLRTLVTRLHDTMDPSGDIALTVAAPDVEMSLDVAVPCGLIVNELVTNAFKYAFPPDRRGNGGTPCHVAVTASYDGELVTLSVSDNGAGLPEAVSVPRAGTSRSLLGSSSETSGLGLNLVRLLSEHQLGGTFTVEQGEETTFRVTFSPARYDR